MNLDEHLVALLTRLSDAQRTEVHRFVESILEDGEPEADRTCNSWADLATTIDGFPTSYEEWISTEEDDYQNRTPLWVFRGQEHASWSLAPSLERFSKTLEELSVENHVMRDFKAKARLYGLDISHDAKEEEWLAVMRHHGVPTKLLDFTYSPYIATYFALLSPGPPEGYAMLWAVELNVLSAAMRRVYASLKHVPRNQSGLLKHPIDYTRPALYPALEHARLSESGYIAPFLPATESLRLSHQQGLFLLNGAPGLSFEDSLRRMLGSDALAGLKKIAISRSIRAEALRKLQQMNIHELSLFPGLDGLARFVTLKAELFCPRTATDGM